MFGPPAQEGMDLQLNPLHKREDAEEMELEEIEDPPAHPVTPPARRQRSGGAEGRRTSGVASTPPGSADLPESPEHQIRMLTPIG